MKTMTSETSLVCGIVGTSVGAVGASMSVNELQAIISIVVTILGFLISVVVPAIVRVVMKIKKAKEDGVITNEEKKEIMQEVIKSGNEIAQEGKEVIKTVSSEKEEESDKKSEGEQ